jgi:hypothetical protein
MFITEANNNTIITDHEAFLEYFIEAVEIDSKVWHILDIIQRYFKPFSIDLSDCKI